MAPSTQGSTATIAVFSTLVEEDKDDALASKLSKLASNHRAERRLFKASG